MGILARAVAMASHGMVVGSFRVEWMVNGSGVLRKTYCVRMLRAACCVKGRSSDLRFEGEAAFFEADVAVAADNDVVEDLDVEEAAGFDDHLGDADVFGAGRGVAAGVVVDDDDGGGEAADRLTEDLADAHDGGVEAAGVDGVDMAGEVLGVEDHDAQLFDFEEGHFEHEDVGDVIGRANLGFGCGRRQIETQAQFEGGLDLGGLGGADAVDLADLGGGGLGNAMKIVEALEQGLGQAQGVFVLGAGTDEDAEQFGGRHGGWADVLQAIGGTKVGGQFSDQHEGISFRQAQDKPCAVWAGNRDTMQPATWEIVGCCLARFRVQVEGR